MVSSLVNGPICNLNETMRQVTLDYIAVNGPFLVCNFHHERPFMAMLMSHSRGTCLIIIFFEVSMSVISIWRLSTKNRPYSNYSFTLRLNHG